MKKTQAFISLGLCLILLLIYGLRPNWATALTIFPAWVWLAFWGFAIPVRKKKMFWVVTGSWLFFGFSQVEEWQSILRAVVPVNEVENELRVTTINCSGSLGALKDAFLEEPDILLVQESPRQEDLEKLVSQHEGYVCVCGLDASIIAKGEISSPQGTPFYQAAYVVVDSQSYFVVSLRLATSNPRVDLWNSDCWEFQSRMRRRQLSQIDEVIGLFPKKATLIVGGDFNVPQRDRVYARLEGRLKDSFATGGRGWCNTILADVPVLRIDQIWTSQELSSFQAYARKSEYADHCFWVTRLGVKAVH